MVFVYLAKISELGLNEGLSLRKQYTENWRIHPTGGGTEFPSPLAYIVLLERLTPLQNTPPFPSPWTPLRYLQVFFPPWIFSPVDMSPLYLYTIKMKIKLDLYIYVHIH